MGPRPDDPESSVFSSQFISILYLPCPLPAEQDESLILHDQRAEDNLEDIFRILSITISHFYVRF